MSEELLPEVDEEPEEDDEARYSGADPTLFTATTGTEEYEAISLLKSFLLVRQRHEARPDGGRGNRKPARTAGARPSSQSLSGER